MDLDWREDVEELGGSGEGETVIRTHYMENLFSILKSIKKILVLVS